MQAQTAQKRSQLRAVAIPALARHGIEAEPTRRKGVAPGARLSASEGGGAPFEISVRTTFDRTVGAMRTPAGRWMPMADVSLVVVVACGESGGTDVEVLCFRSEVLIEQLEARYRGLGRAARPAKTATPIFLDLESEISTGNTLADQTLWCEKIKLESPGRRPLSERLREIKEEIAAMHGVDVDAVTIKIELTP